MDIDSCSLSIYHRVELDMFEKMYILLKYYFSVLVIIFSRIKEFQKAQKIKNYR